MRGTGLLDLCGLEYIGQYHKPMAEMHPGQRLTGPIEEEKKKNISLNLKSFHYHKAGPRE
jgi:hypothetical protein